MTTETLELSRTEQQPADRFLDRDQAARYLCVRTATLDSWRCSGQYSLPFLKVGGRVRYRREDLDDWLRRQTMTETVKPIKARKHRKKQLAVTIN